MDPIQLRFLTEKYEKENRKFIIPSKFVPSFTSKPITGKFYAKHDALLLENLPEVYLKLINEREDSTPKRNYSFPPPSVNMEYGWFIEPLISPTKDPRLNFATKSSDFLKTELKLRHLNRGVPATKFVGIPFKC